MSVNQIRPFKPATVQRDEARRNRNKLLEQNLLLVRILSFHYESHLTPTWRGEGHWNWLVCIHFPSGPVQWRLTPDDEVMFAHLKREESHEWDRATQQDKMERLAAVES